MRLWIIFLMAVGGVLCGRATEQATLPPVELRFRLGDDPRWAAKDWNDADWEKKQYRHSHRETPLLPRDAGPFWVRFTIAPSDIAHSQPTLTPFLWPKTEPNFPINSVAIAAAFTFELYWDGQFIAKNGVVGSDRASEKPGLTYNILPIPPELLGPGPHVIALRISSYHFNFSSPGIYPTIVFENYASRMVHETKGPFFSVTGAVGFVLIALMCGFLYWFVDRRRSLAILTALSVAIAVFYTIIAWGWLHNDPYPWLVRRYELLTLSMTVITVLMPWLLLDLFRFARKRVFLAALLPLIALSWWFPHGYWDKVIWLSRVMLVACLALALTGLFRRKVGSLLVVLGVLTGFIILEVGGHGSLGPCFVSAFGSLFAFLLGSVAVNARKERKLAREVLSTKARLEFELLKKSIQPHFVVNTLTALTEVIENDPTVGVKFIEDLAAEFRSLAHLAGEREVTLARELVLCRAHLRLVSIRSGVEAELECEGTEPEFEVPPSLFLTLIENGLSHQRVHGQPRKFFLRMMRTMTGVRFLFFSPGQVDTVANRRVGGTGLKYVKARLEETYPGGWDLAQHAVAGGWETGIEIKFAAKTRTHADQATGSGWVGFR